MLNARSPADRGRLLGPVHNIAEHKANRQLRRLRLGNSFRIQVYWGRTRLRDCNADKRIQFGEAAGSDNFTIAHRAVGFDTELGDHPALDTHGHQIANIGVLGFAGDSETPFPEIIAPGSRDNFRVEIFTLHNLRSGRRGDAASDKDAHHSAGEAA